jgi:hypothetical protein
MAPSFQREQIEEENLHEDLLAPRERRFPPEERTI